MRIFSSIDLSTDAGASAFVKDETVGVVFATRDGELQSREGTNRYRGGDALITGSTGDCWSVSRERFNARYLPVAPTLAGGEGRYRARPVIVLAMQIPVAFCVARSAGGDMLRGQADDWLLQYAPGDHGVVGDARFQRVYRRATGMEGQQVSTDGVPGDALQR